MWSKAARVAARAREAVQARADASERASERTNLVPSTSAREAAPSVTRDGEDRNDGVGRAPGALVGEVMASARRARDGTRSPMLHLVPGIVAIAACALVFWCGSLFVEHPIWKFEHVSRARRAAAIGHTGPMTCHKNEELTGSESCLPAFAVIGSHIGGTRQLKALMSQHDMLTEGQKTMHFFNPVYGATQGTQMCDPPKLLLKAYFSAVQAGHGAKWSPYDPSETMKAKRDGDAFQRKSGDVVSGDWSDTYFHCACCASTMKKMMPHLRPIVVLRDPIGRTMARYVEENHPSGTPLDAAGLSACALKENGFTWSRSVGKMKEFLSQCLKETDGNDPSTLTRECLDFHSFLGWSMYADYLEVWLKEYPNLLVLYADDIEENPIEVAKAVETYLGLPPNSSPYKTAGLGALEDTNLGSIAFDVQTQLTKAKDDRQATADLVEYFKPNVKRLHDMAEKGIIPALPYKWMRRYDIPVKHEIKAFRKLLALDDAEFKGLLKSLRQTDNKLDDLVADTTRAKSISGSKVGIDQVLEGIGGGNKRSASGESDDDALIDAFLNGAHLPAGDNTGSSNSPSSSTTVIGRDGKPVRNEGNVTGAKGNVTDAKDADDFSKLKSKSKLLQKQAERKERLTKPHWEAGTVRGRFYSDLYVPMDREIRDSLKGNLFVPVAVPYLFQFANEFKHNKAWMDIVGIKKEDQARVYSELWRDDCTHSQQWSAVSGCCGTDCCFVGGHRQDTVGLRGK